MTAEQQSGKKPVVAWRQSLGAGLLLGLALGCAWLVRFSPVWPLRLVLVGVAVLLALLGLSLMVSVTERRSWMGALQQPLEVHFAGAGVPFFAVLAILTLAAVTSGNNLLYLMVSGLLAALAVSGLASALNLSGMELRFRLPPGLQARVAAPVQFTLSNVKGFWPAYSVTVSGGSEAAAGGTVAMRPVYFAYLPRRRSVSAASAMTFPRRGRYAPAAFMLETRFPFGLMRKRRRFQSEQREPDLLVYPAPLPPAGSAAAGLRTGLWALPQRRGEGQDLYRIREHQPGDGARQVHWKASARAGALRVREFNQEAGWRVRLRLALPPGLETERAEAAISLCAGWLQRLLEVEEPARADHGEIWLEFAGENPGPVADGLAQGLRLPLKPAAQHRHAILEYLALVDPAQAPLGGRYDPENFEILVDGSDISLAVSNRSASGI